MTRGYVHVCFILALMLASTSFRFSLLLQTSKVDPSTFQNIIPLESGMDSYANPYASLFSIYQEVVQTAAATTTTTRNVNDNSHSMDFSENTTITNSTSKKNSPYAYAFVIGGCDPQRPSYRNYVYDILISSHILRERGSKADVVAFFQMSFHSKATTLPAEDIRLLTAMQVKIKYIPKSRDESFYRVMLDKFRILGMTEYRRVLFLDGDVIPLVNLDYLFELSDPADTTTPTVLMENLVVAGSQEPANGGFFMLAPHAGALQQVNRIIQTREEHASNNQQSSKNETRQQRVDKLFDPVQGWGHAIDPSTGDAGWVTNGKRAGTNWTFWAAFADQGLLYHYTKYVRKSVTIVLADQVQNWGTTTNDTGSVIEGNGSVHTNVSGAGVRLLETLKFPFQNYSQPSSILYQKCGRWTSGKGCPSPYSDYFHFTGKGKPWFNGPPSDLSNKTKTASAEHFWWYTLTILNDQLDMGIGDQLQNWTAGDHHRPLLGMHPAKWQAVKARTNLEETMNTPDATKASRR
jgi:hypothetical protein